MPQFTAESDGGIIAIRTHGGCNPRQLPHRVAFVFIAGLSAKNYSQPGFFTSAEGWPISEETYDRRIDYSSRFYRQVKKGTSVEIPGNPTSLTWQEILAADLYE